MDADELKNILSLHQKWLNDEKDGIQANLNYANLMNANLNYANLNYANLENAYLKNAILYNAYLKNANLYNANLYNANLYNANLKNAILPYFQLPEGTLVGYGKKNGVIIKMLIPNKAKRTACLINRKCRCSYAYVLDVFNDKKEVVVKNKYGETKYKKGCIVKPHDYCDDIRIDCAPGIHLFLTKEEAENFQM